MVLDDGLDGVGTLLFASCDNQDGCAGNRDLFRCFKTRGAGGPSYEHSEAVEPLG